VSTSCFLQAAILVNFIANGHGILRSQNDNDKTSAAGNIFLPTRKDEVIQFNAHTLIVYRLLSSMPFAANQVATHSFFDHATRFLHSPICDLMRRVRSTRKNLTSADVRYEDKRGRIRATHCLQDSGNVDADGDGDT
jgi:hypothetical protein